MADEPETKKAKLNYDLNKLKNDLISSRNNLTAVLSDEYHCSIEYVEVFIGNVNDKRKLSMLIKLLNERMPLKELQHLKRVNKNHVLLCLVGDNKKEQVEDILHERIQDFFDTFDSIDKVSVPLNPPKSRKQYVEANQKWPCNYHPNKYLEKLLSHSFFEQKELIQHRLLMSVAIDAAKLYFKSRNQDWCNNFNVAIVYDPLIESIVTISIDNRKNHPIQHATMIAIDNVAKTQNGGNWSDNSSEILKDLKQTYPDLKFGYRQYISKSEKEKELECPYLCTGYYIYLLREPCVMCSMGLVHARIKRMFFCYENERQGAVMSRDKLHCVASLNHHFEVFTGFFGTTKRDCFSKLVSNSSIDSSLYNT